MKARQAEATVAKLSDNKKKEEDAKDPANSEACERRVRVETEKAY